MAVPDLVFPPQIISVNDKKQSGADEVDGFMKVELEETHLYEIVPARHLANVSGDQVGSSA